MSNVKITPLGGLGEIGMNCLILETENEILIIDCGLMFSDLQQFGIEFSIPNFSYLLDRKEKIKGFIITHGHEDHTGALPFALRAGIRAPIYASPFSSYLIREKLVDYGVEHYTHIQTFQIGEALKFQDFSIQTISVNHSIVDAAALLISTPIGNILHTGDFKIDPTPYYGTTLDQQLFGKAGDDGVLLLLSDSTNVERRTDSGSEKDVYDRLDQVLPTCQGMTVLSLFASNISRIGQIFELAQKHNKHVALSGRTLEKNVQLAIEAGYLKNSANVLIPLDRHRQVKRDELIIVATGSQGEYRSSLIRMAQGDHPFLQLEPRDTVILSSKFIPGNEKAIGRMINHLFQQGATVLYEAIEQIHVSGHATRPELKKMLELVRPRFFMPIHGEYRHLVLHAELAQETGIPVENICVATNGNVLELTAEKFEKIDHFEEFRLWIDGHQGMEIPKYILKERRQLAEAGIAVAMTLKRKRGRTSTITTTLDSRGLVDDNTEAWLLEEAQKHLQKFLNREETDTRQKRGQKVDLAEALRVELRQFFQQNIGRKPPVLSIVTEID